MNKLALTVATVAALSLSTVAFAQTTSAPSAQQRVQPMQSQINATQQGKQSQMRATQHVNKRHHARHYASHKGNKVVVKHTPATKTVKTKAS